MAQSLNQFVSTYNGKRVDVDGSPKIQPYQCWDLAAKYSNKVVGVPTTIQQGLPTRPGGNGCAADVFYKFIAPLPKYYKRIANNRGDKNQLPKAGDIVVFKYSLVGSGGCGHVAVCLAANKAGFVSLDQNWGGAYAHKVRHTYKDVAGWLRPIHNTAAAKPTQKPIYYTLKPSDYRGLIWLASRLHVAYSTLLKLNPKIKNPSKVGVGQKIRIK